ncbi:hypothetical protein BCA37_16980 [Mycobacterium sp. djl-10]|nr:hypothetical protein BCA37_16980 [Mycobacterium sp. djl-10]
MATVSRFVGLFCGVVLFAAAGTGVAWSDGPTGGGEADISAAVGSGVLDSRLVGFIATGPTNEAASAAVIAACQSAGALDCSRDEVSNDDLCLVSVGVDDGRGIVAGGAGPTVEVARDDAIRHAEVAGAPLGPGARILASTCAS